MYIHTSIYVPVYIYIYLYIQASQQLGERNLWSYVSRKLEMYGNQGGADWLSRHTVLRKVYDRCAMEDNGVHRVLYVDCRAFEDMIPGDRFFPHSGDSEYCLGRLSRQQFRLRIVWLHLIGGLRDMARTSRRKMCVVFWCRFGCRRSVAVSSAFAWLCHRMGWRNVNPVVCHLSSHTWPANHCGRWGVQCSLGQCGQPTWDMDFDCLGDMARHFTQVCNDC